MLILIISLWLLTGITTGVVASDKGHGFGSWAIAGFLLGPLGLIAAAGLSDQKLREYIRRTIEPQSFNSIKNNPNLLGRKDLYLDSIPKLLSESESKSNYQTLEASRKYIGDFLLNKNAPEDKIWNEIIQMLEEFRPDIVSLADRSTSNRSLALEGGMIAYMVCNSDGSKLALAYAKEISGDDNYYWQLRLY